MNSFNCKVKSTRTLGDYTMITVTTRDGNWEKYHELRFKAEDAPDLRDGTEITVSYENTPEARGYESKKTNPNTGKPYINALCVFYNPRVETAVEQGAGDAHTPADDDFGSEIPF